MPAIYPTVLTPDGDPGVWEEQSRPPGSAEPGRPLPYKQRSKASSRFPSHFAKVLFPEVLPSFKQPLLALRFASTCVFMKGSPQKRESFGKINDLSYLEFSYSILFSI
jgi:hypothetical protein